MFAAPNIYHCRVFIPVNMLEAGNLIVWEGFAEFACPSKSGSKTCGFGSSSMSECLST